MNQLRVSSGLGWLMAVFAGPLIVVAFALPIMRSDRFNLAEELPVLIFNAVSGSVPFIVLAALKARNVPPWTIAWVVSIGFWTVLSIDAGIGRGGVNIGLALIGLTMPVWLSVIAIAFIRP